MQCCRLDHIKKLNSSKLHVFTMYIHTLLDLLNIIIILKFITILFAIILCYSRCGVATVAFSKSFTSKQFYSKLLSYLTTLTFIMSSNCICSQGFRKLFHVDSSFVNLSQYQNVRHPKTKSENHDKLQHKHFHSTFPFSLRLFSTVYGSVQLR